MKNNIQISIPNPCSENWDKMQPDACGRFCQSCQKTVTDFTWMSDDAFITHFQNTKTSSCGRFTERQLALKVPVKSTPLLPFWKMSKYIAASMIAAAGLSGKVFGQKVEVAQISNNLKANNEEHTVDTNEKIEIKGNITDDQHQGSPGASVSIKSLQIGAVTDVDGNFILSFPKNLLNSDSFNLSIDALGYQSSMLTLNINAIPILNIKLVQQSNLLGEVIYYRPTTWQRFKRWVKINFE